MSFLKKTPKKSMTTQNQLVALRTFIKRQLKLRQMSYRELARRLNVSEVTVKRWLSNADISSRKLIEMGQVLEFSPFSMIQADFSAAKQFKFYNEAQENFLIKNPKLFLIFIKLAFGFSLSQIKDLLQIDDLTLRQSLKKMEKVKLLELWPGDQIKIKLTGPYRMQAGGAMAKKFQPLLRDVVMDYFRNTVRDRFEDPQFPLCTLFRPTEIYLTQESAVLLAQELNTTFSKYAQKSIIEANNQEKVEAISILLGVARHDSWLKVLR